MADSERNNVSNNTITVTNNDDSSGIHISDSDYNTIANNILNTSGKSFKLTGSSGNNNFESNTVLQSSSDAIFLYKFCWIGCTYPNNNNLTNNILNNIC